MTGIKKYFLYHFKTGIESPLGKGKLCKKKRLTIPIIVPTGIKNYIFYTKNDFDRYKK